MEALAFGLIVLHVLIERVACHRMTPFLVFDALEFFILRTAELAFLTPETDVRKKSFSVFKHV